MPLFLPVNKKTMHNMYVSLHNSNVMVSLKQPYTLAGYEPRVLCSSGNDHCGTPANQFLFFKNGQKFIQKEQLKLRLIYLSI
jgi:hypothetical protein